jgi:hypothetical protein
MTSTSLHLEKTPKTRLPLHRPAFDGGEFWPSSILYEQNIVEIKVCKILESHDLGDRDLFSSSQNIEPEGVVCKIFRNKELARASNPVPITSRSVPNSVRILRVWRFVSSE